MPFTATFLLMQQRASAQDPPFFWSSGSQVLHTLFMTIAAYVALVVVLRIAGKRSLSQMHAYDLVVTVAIGSTLASAITSPDVSLADGAGAIALLIGLQYLLATLAVKSPRLENLLNGQPILLFHNGQFLRKAMQAERITEEEVRAAVRLQGVDSLGEVAAVVVETNGMLSVVWQGRGPSRTEERSSRMDVAVDHERELRRAERAAGNEGRAGEPLSGDDRDAPGA